MNQKLGIQFKPRSHVPGYCGYIPGAKSENLYGKTYGKITQEVTNTQQALNQQRFKTTNVNNNLLLRDQILKSANEQQFWNKDHNLDALKNSESKMKQTKLNRQKYEPKVQTNLTYQQAINTK